MKLKSTLVVILAICMMNIHAQSTDDILGQQVTLNTITTAVPFLMITPDARAAGMGDAGVSSSPDAYSMHWNPAKYAFIEDDMGFGVSYSPWLKELISDVNLYNVGFFKRLDDDQVIASTLTYFSVGEILFRQNPTDQPVTVHPNEFSIDFAYSRKLSENLSGSVAARFIYSDLNQGQGGSGNDAKAGSAVAVDVSMYYHKDVRFNRIDGQFAFGVNMSNIGTKISYSNSGQKNFLPTNLRFGPSLTLELDRYNTLSFMLDFNKLLVPTPPTYKTVNGEQVIDKGKDPNVSVPQGIFQSFFDAPGGFSEELKEYTYSIGVEYWYDKQFALRAGYFHEAEMKGDRQYFTLGIGLKYNVFGLDIAYLVPTDQQNPLEKTLRFSLLFNFASL